MSNQPPDQPMQPPSWGQPPPPPGGPTGWAQTGQPPPQPPRRHRTGLILALAGAGLLLIVIVATVAALQTDPTAKRAATATTRPTTTVPGTTEPTTQATEEPTTTEPEVAKGGVGDTLSVENADGPLGDITVIKVRSAARDPDPYLGERAKRGRFLIVTVAVKATGDGFDINPLDFYAREGGGRHIEEQCCADFGEELEALTLNKGEKTDGVMVFDTRPGPVSLVYAPNFDESAIGEWKLA